MNGTHGPLDPETWRRIGAVLDRVTSVDRRLDPEALAEACRAEGIHPDDVMPFLEAEGHAAVLPEQLDPAVLNDAFREFEDDTAAPAFGIGDRIGPYELVALLGSGGMGAVYKARDTRLGRTVALKFLHARLASHPDSRLRFEREARAISALNHPHICTLHDVGQHEDIEFLVMELVTGDTLAARLQGALPLREVLEYGAQIADALAAAHREGIVHRDLKPSNVMLTAHGVKLLDFGLAALRARDEPIAPSRAPASEAHGAAVTDPSLTADGSILGTLHYMAPEQVQGKAVDARADIFALGAMLYEMLTGRKPFEGGIPASVIAAIVEREPEPPSAQRPDADGALDWVVGQCLAKDPDRRWQNAGDLARQLRWIASAGRAGAPQSSTDVSRRSLIVGIAAAAVAIVAGVVAYLAATREATPVRSELFRFELAAPVGTQYEQLLALAPDGRRVAFTATDSRGVAALWIRPLDGLEPQRIDGTEGGFFPFWKPDGSAIGFFADGALKRVDLETGDVRMICAAGFGGGGTWNADDVILFAAESAASAAVRPQLQRVSAAGGSPKPATSKAEPFDRRVWPHFLPDGRHYLYMGGQAGEKVGVYVGVLDSDEHTPIVTAQDRVPDLQNPDDLMREFPTGIRARQGLNTRAVYAAGRLFYLRDGALVAQPFDASRLALTGEAVQIVDAVWLDAPGRSAFDVSANGVLAYRSPVAPDVTQLTWFDRGGREIGRLGDPGPYYFVALSQDGRSVLTGRSAGPRQGRTIVRIDVATGTSVPVGERGSLPVWSPDGSQFVYRHTAPLTHIAPTDGSDLVGRPLSPLMYALPFDWSRDGRIVIGQVYRAETKSYDVWASVVGTGKFSFLLESRFAEMEPQISPDQQWLAYASNYSGRFEVYVRPFDRPGSVVPVSRNGGRRPRWNGDGTELFFVEADGDVVRAAIRLGATAGIMDRESLFRQPSLSYTDESGTPGLFDRGLSYDVTKDGQRFLCPVPLQTSQPSAIVVLSNWPALMRD
jgi:serine/threonine protein kinase/Tol biopolymer transport system component